MNLNNIDINNNQDFFMNEVNIDYDSFFNNKKYVLQKSANKKEKKEKHKNQIKNFQKTMKISNMIQHGKFVVIKKIKMNMISVLIVLLENNNLQVNLLILLTQQM